LASDAAALVGKVSLSFLFFFLNVHIYYLW